MFTWGKFIDWFSHYRQNAAGGFIEAVNERHITPWESYNICKSVKKALIWI